MPGTSPECSAWKPGKDTKSQTIIMSISPRSTLALQGTRDVSHAGKAWPSPAPTVRLVLCAALIKFDHFEWMIEKATELGVSEIVPVETIRSERGLERAAHKRVERWRRIALEASQQSRRAFLPEVSEPESLRDALDREANYRFALDENPAAQPLNTALPSARNPQDAVAMLIGPEGGWTDDERAQFTAAGWLPVSLGSLILRAETAALAALAIVNSAWLLH